LACFASTGQLAGIVTPRLTSAHAQSHSHAGRGARCVVDGDVGMDVRDAIAGNSSFEDATRSECATRGTDGHVAGARTLEGRQLQPPDGTADRVLRDGDLARTPRSRRWLGDASCVGVLRAARGAQFRAGAMESDRGSVLDLRRVVARADRHGRDRRARGDVLGVAVGLL